MLRILLAICETALDAFHAANNPVDAEFVGGLERITERTRQELVAIAGAKPLSATAMGRRGVPRKRPAVELSAP